MRRAALIGALCVACGGDDAPASDAKAGEANVDPTPAEADAGLETPPAPDEPEGFVVLRASTPLHRRPSAEAASVTFDPRGPGSLGETFRAFEIVGHEAEWIQIRNLGEDAGEQHCTRGWAAMQDFSLTFWVRKTDVQSVTRRPVIETFADGSSAMIAAGTPMMLAGRSGDEMRWTALGPGASAELPVPDGAVGSFYRPSALYQPKAVVSSLPRSAGLELEGRPIHNGPLLGEPTIDVFEKEPRDDGTLVTVGTRCAELRVLARGVAPDSNDLGRELAPNAGLLGSPPPVGTRSYAFPTGAEVFWLDGEKAGELVAPHTFDTNPDASGDNRCFEHANLTLCLRADDMTISEPPKILGVLGGPEAARLGELGIGEGTIGLGELGTIGRTPRRAPRLLHGTSKVRTSKAKVKGALDKDVIRRIVRRHINEVRHCYEKGLSTDPSLKGRVEVQFTISPKGKVPVAVVAKSTVGDKTVANCIAKTVKRWKFPEPTGGGNVVVTYPFVLSPG